MTVAVTAPFTPDMKRTTTAAVAAVAILAAAPPAAATPQQDGQFLYALGEVGIGYGSASAVIVAGHSVCDALDTGLPVADVVTIVDDSTGLERRGAYRFVAISIGTYCGHHGDAIRPHDQGDGTRKTGVIA